jgi:hypothetical protein
MKVPYLLYRRYGWFFYIYLLDETSVPIPIVLGLKIIIYSLIGTNPVNCCIRDFVIHARIIFPIVGSPVRISSRSHLPGVAAEGDLVVLTCLGSPQNYHK